MTITRITDKNIAFFQPVIPDAMLVRSNLALGVLSGGEACGVLLANIQSTYAELLWIFVDEKHRDLGCGEQLMSAFTDIADGLNLPISFFTLNESQHTEEFVSFLDSKTGFVRELENKGESFSFFLKSVKSKPSKRSDTTGIKPLSAVLSREEKMIHNLLNETFGVSVTEYDMTAWKDSNLSFLKVSDKRIESFILIRLTFAKRSTNLMVDYIYDQNHDFKNIFALIDTVKDQTAKLYMPPNTLVQTVSLNSVITGLLYKITDGDLTKEGDLTVWTRRTN